MRSVANRALNFLLLVVVVLFAMAISSWSGCDSFAASSDVTRGIGR